MGLGGLSECSGIGDDWIKDFNHCSVTAPKSGLYSRGQGVLEERVICSKLHCLEAKVNMDHIQLPQSRVL